MFSRMPFIHAQDSTQLFWRDWGHGAPILFLNSLGLGTQMWDYQFAAFAEPGCRCIGLDRRGHGRSDEPGCGYDLDTLADDVATLIDTLDLQGVTLIGHSMAGSEIVRYLTRHGSTRVARIILLAPMTPKLLESMDDKARFDHLFDQWRRDYPKWVDDETPPFFVPETSRAMMQWAATLIERISLPVALACGRAMVGADLREEMRAIDVPALIIHGDRDRSAPIERTGHPSAQLIPQCKLLVYEGAPHGMMYTHMARLHADIRQFVRET